MKAAAAALLVAAFFLVGALRSGDITPAPQPAPAVINMSHKAHPRLHAAKVVKKSRTKALKKAAQAHEQTSPASPRPTGQSPRAPVSPSPIPSVKEVSHDVKEYDVQDDSGGGRE